jgi:hypothetical protein
MHNLFECPWYTDNSYVPQCALCGAKGHISLDCHYKSFSSHTTHTDSHDYNDTPIEPCRICGDHGHVPLGCPLLTMGSHIYSSTSCGDHGHVSSFCPQDYTPHFDTPPKSRLETLMEEFIAHNAKIQEDFRETTETITSFSHLTDPPRPLELRPEQLSDIPCSQDEFVPCTYEYQSEPPVSDPRAHRDDFICEDETAHIKTESNEDEEYPVFTDISDVPPSHALPTPPPQRLLDSHFSPMLYRHYALDDDAFFEDDDSHIDSYDQSDIEETTPPLHTVDSHNTIESQDTNHPSLLFMYLSFYCDADIIVESGDDRLIGHNMIPFVQKDSRDKPCTKRRSIWYLEFPPSSHRWKVKEKRPRRRIAVPTPPPPSQNPPYPTLIFPFDPGGRRVYLVIPGRLLLKLYSLYSGICI